jgi:hypothetical protein
MARPAAPDDLIIGRAAILAAFEGRPLRTMRLVCANVVIDVESASTARGTSAILLFTSREAPPRIGGFDDFFIDTGAGRRFALRRGMLSL